jgi:hypothetical protein
MANYLSIPILDALIRSVEEDSPSESGVISIASAVLSHLFQPANGFTMVAGQHRDNTVADVVILRVQRLVPGHSAVVDHTVVEVKRGPESIGSATEQMETIMKGAITEFGRCWAVIVRGPQFMFMSITKIFPTTATSSLGLFQGGRAPTYVTHVSMRLRLS